MSVESKCKEINAIHNDNASSIQLGSKRTKDKMVQFKYCFATRGAAHLFFLDLM